MTWAAQPNSTIITSLKLVAGGAFLVLGIILIVQDGSWIDGLAIAGASAAWLFFVIRNYRKYQLSLQSLR